MKTILDTSTIISKPDSLLEFENVVVPYVVLNQLDGLKRDKTLNYYVRKAVRIILKNNIKCEDLANKYLALIPKKTDDILIKLSRKDLGKFKLITDDFLMYQKGNSRNCNIELYNHDIETYTGVAKDKLPPSMIDQLYDKGKIKFDYEGIDYYENQFIDADDIVVRYKDGWLYKVDWNRCVNGLENNPTRRQLMALDVLFDKDVSLVSMFGSQGTGKTTLAINSAIRQAANGDYGKILISRAKKKRDIDEGFGYLTGGLEEKYKPFNAPFYDNLYTQTPIHLETVPLSSIQGRNFNDSVWVITEAQDIAPEHTELIVGRCGENTKLILEGDLKQNSSNDLNKYYNGLTHVINKLKDEPITATVKLDETKEDIKRSELAKVSLKLGDR
ncbi:MAG: PhoH family protein [Nanoarchaeota archaeon]